ncbi:Nop-domain-containing protein [Coniophora puteana RWD-64-598 SS2]|uniref:Nucleolar protein 56 n=1 Tax=Coniophora puteana (strain RWD-64-598) TaxID=741705 RepID=A0A5M3MPN5_CONPW|nr:Nop-domain-containing protein [Coniophora puteana RWD-64-598 SS2]EIW81149.1 Nop-domain-containing protein [Coniophora puteana RWD-64-598 SS2]
MVTHALFESASGYAIFKVKLHEDIGTNTQAMQDSIDDLSKFAKMVTLVSFSPFKSAADALENINDVSEGLITEHLRSILELNLSKSQKASKISLAVFDSGLASNIKDTLNIGCDTSEISQTIIRGIRQHAAKLLTGLEANDLSKAQLGLGHSYSRAKLKFNVNRVDNMIIQASALLDQLDKDVNLFAMRVREWYGYHFPELAKLVADNYAYARVALFVGDKDTLDEARLPDLARILEDDATAAQNVLDAARGSMGSALSDVDMLNISAFAQRVISIADYRRSLVAYLSEKMNQVAPSLTALLGERIGARLISHAGSLTNLSKYPASTVQILGAEKALFRALKTKGNTPKYGLLYHSSFIGRAGPKHKGRISRFLANKCSIASRIDCYTDNPTPKFGVALREQVEERLTFFETGAPPSKNADAIRKVLDSLDLEDDDEEDEDAEPALPLIEAEPPKKKGKKDKKEKKDKKRKADEMEVDEDEETESEPVKKVKLSKEEKKALKKAAKKEAKKVAKEAEDAGDGESKKEKKKKEKKQKDKS